MFMPKQHLFYHEKKIKNDASNCPLILVITLTLKDLIFHIRFLLFWFPYCYRHTDIQLNDMKLAVMTDELIVTTLDLSSLPSKKGMSKTGKNSNR